MNLGSGTHEFTVDPATVTKALPLGAQVRVYQPPILGL